MDNGADAYPNDPNRWGDSDGDGYDDGLDDDCPALFGTSVTTERDVRTKTVMVTPTLTAVGRPPTAPTPS